MSDPIALDAAQAKTVLRVLGGVVEVARLTFNSTSTVHSWGDNGMPKARFDHVCLAALARGKGDELSEALDAISQEPALPFPETAIP